MNNELILLIHIVCIASFLGIAQKMGQNALISFVALCMVLANLFVTKQILVGGMNATAADVLAIGSMLGLNMLQEFFTRESARQAIMITFFTSIFFALVSAIHLWYIPSPLDTMHQYFYPILSPAPALVIGSIAIYFLSQWIDYGIYGLLKKIWQSRFLIARNYVAIGLSQAIDTMLFSLFLRYLGIVTDITSLVIVSFSIKFIITLIATPLIAYASGTRNKS